MDYENFLKKELDSDILCFSTQSGSNDSRVRELEETNKKLQKQVEDYLAVLQTTVNVLNLSPKSLILIISDAWYIYKWERS